MLILSNGLHPHPVKLEEEVSVQPSPRWAGNLRVVIFWGGYSKKARESVPMLQPQAPCFN